MSELKKSEHKFINMKSKKLLKYMIMFKDILTFLGPDYRDASLITLYFVVLGISIPKIREIARLSGGKERKKNIGVQRERE